MDGEPGDAAEGTATPPDLELARQAADRAHEDVDAAYRVLSGALGLALAEHVQLPDHVVAAHAAVHAAASRLVDADRQVIAEMRRAGLIT